MNVQPIEGTGYLIVHVTTARGAIPLEGARVNVRNNDPEFTPDRGDIILSAVTDRSGNTEIFALPAPPRADSQQPGSGRPYATYNIEVSREGFFRHEYTGVPIFDGITAIQPADMIPLPENGISDGLTPDDRRNFITPESQNL